MVRGPSHDFLGMQLYFTQGCVTISMKKYIMEIIETFPDEKKHTHAETPAAVTLFTVRKDYSLLPSSKIKVFHTFVAKLLYLAKRARPDIACAVDFLSTRVLYPDADDWNKLVRCIRYLVSYPDIYLKLSADKLMLQKWWIDASYANHVDCKSHTGSVMSLGNGGVFSHSTKQKINTRSSTEAELVGVDDMMGHVLWTKAFITGQGYTSPETVIYQDNRSAILLETRGQSNAGKRSKHIAVRYYFVKDKVDSNEFAINWCPSNEMFGDYFTKPLQGEMFFRFRNFIMNSFG